MTAKAWKGMIIIIFSSYLHKVFMQLSRKEKMGMVILSLSLTLVDPVNRALTFANHSSGVLEGVFKPISPTI